MKNYKIAVLSDLSSTSEITLKNAISLAKIVGGEIEIFSVKKPLDLVLKENQLSAMRNINSQSVKTNELQRKLINSVEDTFGIKVNTSYALGNVKNEITNFIENYQPDIIVLGKRKARPFKFFGDGIANYVFNTFKGTIMVTSDKNTLEPNTEISLGMFNNLESSVNLKFADDLIAHTQKPLKSFKIVKNFDSIEKVEKPVNKKMIEYVFEEGDSSMKTLANYLNKNNIDLLCLDRMKNQTDSKMNFFKADFKNMMNNLNVNLLVTPEY